MAGTERDVKEARARQMAADVLIHETYRSPNSSAVSFGGQDPNASSSSFGSNIYVPTVKEIEAYSKILNNPGAVMPHGVFVLVDEAQKLRVKGISQNCPSFFEREASELIGTSLIELFDNQANIEAALTMKDLSLANPVTVGIKKDDGQPSFMVNLIFNRMPEGLAIDIEDLDVYENAFSFHQRVRKAVDRLSTCETPEAMCQQVSRDFFQLSGYDRVMMYKFHEDHHGEVVSEFVNDNIKDESWLGLHYPATDIPQRSRDQFKALHVRLIQDCTVPDSPIIMETGSASDMVAMTMSTLRPAHQCHKEYLVNMGVKATIGVAIIVKDQLWGLMIGHHMCPRFCSYQMRMACEFLSQAFAMSLTNLLDKAAHARHERSLQLHSKLCDIMYKQGQNPGLRIKGLISSEPSLKDLIPGVCGAAVVLSGKISSIGDVPQEKELALLVQLVTEAWNNSSMGRRVLTSECLEEWDFEFAMCAEKCAGAMCVPITDDGMLIWFRPELSSTIRWAGGDGKAAVQKSSVMHPRASFEVYTDSIKGRCNPWLKWEVDAAEGLGDLANDIMKADDTLDAGILNRLKDHGDKTKAQKNEAATELIHLIDSVKAPIFGIDTTGAVIQWNKSVAIATGYQSGEVLGRALTDFIDPTNVKVLHEAIKAATDGEGAKGVSLELRNTASGQSSMLTGMKTTSVIANVSARYNSEGLCIGVVFVCTDVTTTRVSSLKQQKMDDQISQAARIAAHLQPNGLDATEDNFSFYPDKEAALLGEGAFGKTYTMKSSLDGQLYAVKMINIVKAERNGLPVDNLKREVQMLLRLSHDNIIRYYTCYMHKKGKFFCIVMELAEGGTWSSVVSRVAKGQACDEKRITGLTLQLCQALKHIHSKKMLHRDMKPDNVLLAHADTEEVKITDFGLACVVSAHEAGARAGTLTYSSPEKANAKPYTSKDDMWAVGCMLSELLTGVSVAKRCGVGIFAFNQELIDTAIRESKAKNAKFGALVERLLSVDPDKRPSAADLVLELDPPKAAPGRGMSSADLDELCEEYACSICQSLVVDAHTVCADEHLFCRTCLEQWLQGKNDCPNCRKASIADKPIRLRVINNAVEKLATRALSPDAQQARRERIAEEAAELEEKMRQLALEKEAPQAIGESGLLNWKHATGKAQYGSDCTVFKHTTSGVVVEVFHGNGWFRFRLSAGGQVQWCNSCGNLGTSDFGSPEKVAVLDAGGGDTIPENGVIHDFEEEAYWSSKIRLERLALSNGDGETLYLTQNGGFVWMSHPGMEKALVHMPGHGDEPQLTSHPEAEATMVALTS
eukprot:CAMPEP_0206226870 /NCGR_PEP_ID=MMETSP0047_2-20121206/8321_1 /ASSEMBLY_ACC=CAM_ASM_000192 /TAXON_ID=195065 /ORGANISM="Chroomonas mesostigmatica_cf, Strain CCMP1168" /LENGTH=1301 /DNA_ID=CAMNT_0053649985 /DNA_START=20 /DNA_END=3925 /DNA_ORIENTATION=-